MSFSELYLRIMNENFPNRKFDTDQLCANFENLSRLLIDYNKKVNLTALVEPGDIIAKHFADSLLIEKYIPKNATLCDIGCGGGFPTLPLAIVRPDINITAVDSTEKKLKFVSLAADELGLYNVTPLAQRAEVLCRDVAYREKFDCVCARAVARLNILSELCLPLVRLDGTFLSCKASAADAEYNEAKNAISLLGASLTHADSTTLFASSEQCERTVFEITKKRPTPDAYPRNYSKISKFPL